jgi:hypothetical protein
MMARQAKQSRVVQAKALQRIVEDGFTTSRAAADAYFKAAQEAMINTDERYERLKRILQNKELRNLYHKLLEMEARLEQEEELQQGRCQ